MLGCVFGVSDSYDCMGDYGSNFDFWLETAVAVVRSGVPGFLEVEK